MGFVIKHGFVFVFVLMVTQAMGRSVLPSCAQEKSEQLSFDYGELGPLEDYKVYDTPRFKSGYDLLQPLTDAFQPYYKVKEKLREASGLSYIIENGFIFQASPNEGGETHANNELNLIGQLTFEVFDGEVFGKTSIRSWYQFSNTVGDTTTSELQAELGVLSPVNGGDTSPGTARDLLQTLFVEQFLFADRARVAFGKLTTRTFLNLNRYAVSDREDFFSPMLVNNPVVLYTSRIGVGGYAQYHAATWYLIGMVRDAGADAQRAFDWSGAGLEYAVELALTPTIKGFGKGNYRFTYHYTESVDNTPSDWDVSLSFDQDFSKRFAGLFRYAYSDKGLRVFKQRLSIALRWQKPFGFLHDRAGIGAWWGDPSDGRFNDEYGLEAFWNLQLTPFFELTPDIQLILNRAGKSSNTPVAIFGLRWRVLL